MNPSTTTHKDPRQALQQIRRVLDRGNLLCGGAMGIVVLAFYGDIVLASLALAR